MCLDLNSISDLENVGSVLKSNVSFLKVLKSYLFYSTCTKL
jgi:hypothetical protein